MVGSHEFAPDNFNAPLPASAPLVSTDQVRRAYDTLGVDVGYLSPESAALFRMARSLPINFQVTGETPVTQRLQVNGLQVGLVLFPAMPLEPDGKPSPTTLRRTLGAVLKAGETLKDTRLVIGVSPWGALIEESALPHLASLYHILLGGGPGMHTPGTLLAQAPGTLWVRPEGKGQSVHLVEVHSLPQKNDPHHWLEGISIITRLVPLDDENMTDPAVAALLR